MADPAIQYNDGVAYEESIGKWSQAAGLAFLQWLEPSSNQRWIDVGCGNGAFTELIVEQCDPFSIVGIDPSDAQLAYARNRLQSHSRVELRSGNAESLGTSPASFDTAVMALVIFFVPNPQAAVAEMRRVVRPGGTVAAYAWDMMNHGFPFDQMQAAMQELGIPPTYPPQAPISRVEALATLWSGAGLENVQTNTFRVSRTYRDFEELWRASSITSSVAPRFKALQPEQAASLRQAMISRHAVAQGGSITCEAQVTAVQGLVPS